MPKNDGVDASRRSSNPGKANMSSASNGGGVMQSKQSKLDFSSPQTSVTVTQTELNKLIAMYVVENMLPLSTVESDSFKSLIAKIPARGGVGPPCRKTFSKYIDTDYAKINVELKKTFSELGYVSTTADIWTAYNKSYLDRESRRFKGHHTHDNIAVELDNIHSHYGMSHKITSTVMDNGSNFVKDEDEVTFTNSVGDDNDNDDNVGVMITLPPHQRCASHTLSLVSCNDVDKWLLSQTETKAVFRSATTKCTGLWNKASRSTVAAETVDGIIGKKLLVPCTTRWNLFYDSLPRICEISLVELNTIFSKFGLTAMTEREHQFIREYCTAMRPLTVKTRFSEVLESEDAPLAAVTLPKFKLHWLRTQEKKDKAKASLLAGCRKIVLDKDQRAGTSTPTCQLSTDSATEDDFFSFEDEDDTSATAESQVIDYFKSGSHGMDSLNRYVLIRNISLRYNAATPSSAPGERLFSLGLFSSSTLQRGTDSLMRNMRSSLF
uniref:HAT C-terminal dimerisation domain-containing protein n=1 Tax=Neolamprologus brichardi TaxID=32507 RepID=A0A3Q4HE36_NEOBR